MLLVETRVDEMFVGLILQSNQIEQQSSNHVTGKKFPNNAYVISTN